MPQPARPLSPFTTIYRWPLAMALSILHRITGIAIAVGLLLVVWLLLGLANGPESYAKARAFCGSWIGLLLLFGWTWALTFHLANGIRHLFWDVGKGYTVGQAKASGVAVVIASLVMTALIWICVLAQGGV